MNSYAQQTLKSPFWLRRFSHQARFAIAAELLAPTAGDRILDYGTGDGMLLVRMSQLHKDIHLFGYEPQAELRMEAESNVSALVNVVAIADTVEALPAFRVNKIACLEVMEHLTSIAQSEAFSHFSRLLPAEGMLLVSVPVEIGPVSLVKNVVRWLAHQSHGGASLRELWQSLIGRTGKIQRRVESGYIHSHVGFDYRQLEKQFQSNGFIPRRRVFSPWPALGGLLNSQVFYLLAKSPESV